MPFGDKLLQFYLNLVYNPAYDFTTAQTSPYQRLQSECIDKLELEEEDKLLCVGTGNEILRLLERRDSMYIVGADISEMALRRAYRKALSRDRVVRLYKMDAQELGFEAESFDKVTS